MKQTTITAPETQRRKQALKTKLRDLIGRSVPREDLQIEYLADPLDQTVSDSNREMALYNIDHKARLIHDVELALEAIEDGAYGVCEHCEQPIAAKRLQAVPWARLCIGCQSAEESSGLTTVRSDDVPVFSYAA